MVKKIILFIISLVLTAPLASADDSIIPVIQLFTKKNTFSLQAEAQCLVDAGIRVSTSSSLEKTRSSHPYLELIDKNCLPSEIGKDFENICRFLKAEKYNKFNEIKKRIPGATAEDINNFVNIIKGDLSSYNWALSVMSNKNASKEDSDKAELLKHRIEENWLTSKFFKKLKNGRLDMLKAAISISVLLRSAINIKPPLQPAGACLLPPRRPRPPSRPLRCRPQTRPPAQDGALAGRRGP